MGRKLATFALMAAVGVSSSASAIGLGQIETKSALNEPLSARIPLFSVGDTSIRNVKAELASPEAFDRAGIDRPFYLSRLKFQVKKGPDGRPTIEVSTENAIKEPFLDFLVQIRWPEGRMLREYTVLLDPPLYTDDVPARTASAPSNGAQSQAGSSAPASSPAAPAPTVVASSGGESASGETAGGDAGGTTVGPVGADDTLYSIANQVKPGSVTSNQAMIALLRANPDAFLGNNINRLKRGAVLRVPDRDAMAGIPAAEATRQVREQMASWRAANATEVASSETSKSEPGEKPQTTTDDGQSTAVAREESGHLQVVAPEDARGQQSTTSLASARLEATDENVQTLQKRMGLLEETNASLESENKDLKQQVASMKEDLARLKAMVNVQMEESVAGVADNAAQAESTATPSEAAEPESAKAETAAANEDAVAATPQPESAENQAESEATPPAAMASQPPAGAVTPTPEESKPEASKPEASKPEASKPEASKPEASKPAPTLLERVQSILQQLMADPTLLAEVGGGTILLLLLIMLVLRRRRGPSESEDVLDAVVAGPAVRQTAAADAVSRQSEDTSVETDDDPLDQAELLVAYGNLAKAQDVLDDALGEDPDNKVMRAKLIEVLAQRNDRGGFEAEAQVLHTQIESDSDPLWQQTVKLGRRIAPEHPLFADEEDEAATIASELDGAETATPDFGAAETAETSSGDDLFAFELEAGERSQADPQAIDLGQDTGAGQAAAEADHDGDLSFDFALDPAEDETAGEDSRGAGEREFDLVAEEAELDPGLDFELEKPVPAAVSSEPERDTTADEDLDGLEFELPDDLELEEDASAAAAADYDEDDDFSLDFGDFSLHGADELQGRSAEETTDADIDQEDVDALDETGTKLDLARAYLDMGDHDGAKGLLEEVIEEGSGGQQEEAKELLKRTG